MEFLKFCLIVLIFSILLSFIGKIRFSRVWKKFRAGEYASIIPRLIRFYEMEKFTLSAFTKSKRYLENSDTFACMLSVSYFAVKDYENFLFYIDTVKENVEEKHFWRMLYDLTVTKNVASAEEHYANVPNPSQKFSPNCFLLADALFLFEKGAREEAVPMLEDAQSRLETPILKRIASEYLAKYSSEE